MTAAERIQSERQAAATPAQAGSGTVRNSKIVVSVATNSIIFQGTGEEYVQVQNLLKDLDRPSRTVLIEVTVAEVSLTNNESLGIEWALATQTNAYGTVTGGTLPPTSSTNATIATSGLGLGTAGLLLAQFSQLGQARVVLNALASNNRAKILSAPRIVARSGETATIQVGAQVPVITSTQTGLTTGTGVLQSVQYLPTGVILKVKPIVYSGDRIDVEVSQEVSSAESTTTGVSASPTIDTRKVETKIAMRDGATVLLGGLMSSTTSLGNSGVPLLKDIPLIGQLFRVDNNSIQKTELIVLITPYVIGDDIEAQSITNAFRRQLGTWAVPANEAKPARELPSASWLDLIRIPSQQDFPHSDLPRRPVTPSPESQPTPGPASDSPPVPVKQ
jgi:general secretion pathway protein D